MGYNCIVCGVTGSESAQKAALEAAVLARRDSAKLIYVYAVDASFLGRSLMAEVSQTHVEDSLVNLGNHIVDHAEELVGHLGVLPEKIIKKGSPMQVLKEVILERKADLLVVGHEERTRFERRLLQGEVEEHIEAFKKETGIEVMIVE